MTKGRARLAMGQGLSVWVLDAPGGFGDPAFHSHHALQISITFSGSMTLSDGTSRLEAAVMAVAADAEHRFEAEGLLAFLFVEPESRLGRQLATTLFERGTLAAIGAHDFADRIDPLRRAIEPGLSREEMLAIGEAALLALAPEVGAPLPDERIARIVEYAADNLHRDLNLSAAAAGVFLSESRLRHLFVEQTGLAFKTYVLWLRLCRAVHYYSEGRTLTEAAHAAGFADSAHFSRAFKRTFGLPATTLTRL